MFKKIMEVSQITSRTTMWMAVDVQVSLWCVHLDLLEYVPGVGSTVVVFFLFKNTSVLIYSSILYMCTCMYK